MAWLAVNKDGHEVVFSYKPYKNGYQYYHCSGTIELPKGSILKLIGRDLTWEDEPVEI